ncbi:hypothetical protein D7193_15620 [Micromonospora costi]|uniref:Uncharacterized protein n=2 Tax=Micromonospora costi TaxID=1530042 RepID=A0A3B0A679_9ACTN|nr:hypothetical protein D7193_15620 [Micromonospora costi]
MLVDLLPRSAHPGVAAVEPWRGITGGEDERGLVVRFRDGAQFGLKVVAGSPNGGSPTGPDEYEPAGGPPGDVSGVGGDGPTGAEAFAGYLAAVVEAAGHPEVTAALTSQTEISQPMQRSVRVDLVDGKVLLVLFARAAGPGDRRLPDWDVSKWGAMA